MNPQLPDPGTLIVGLLVTCLAVAAIWAFLLIAFCL